MTATTLRLDDALLDQLKSLAKEMGVSFSTLATASLKKTLQERKIELSAPKKYTLLPEYEKEIETNPDFHETVFVAKNEKDIDKFFDAL
jgi:antitoxin component of RelBE/YafQ-DinJ toxin-antitoxin module